MNKSVQISEKQIIAPLQLVLNEVTPRTQQEVIHHQNNPKSIKKSLDQLFPEQEYEEKNLQKAKEILGAVAQELSPEELKVAVTEIQFLVETWLDDFERGIFNGLTLKELLHEKGGL